MIEHRNVKRFIIVSILLILSLRKERNALQKCDIYTNPKINIMTTNLIKLNQTQETKPNVFDMIVFDKRNHYIHR